ncbi:MAG: histidinol-phosphate transaminase [Bacteroidota bacterium]
MIDWQRLARPAVFAIPPYTPGKPVEEVQRELGLTDVVKLASNENPLGPSPKAMAALAASTAQASVYPDAGAMELREAIGAGLGVPASQIIVGNGSDEIIKLAAEALLGPGDEAVICEPTFSEYLYAVQLMGATPVRIRSEGGQDPDAILAAITRRTKVVFLCNPNNPTGTMITREEFSSFLGRLPGNVLAVCDAAYQEYVASPEYPEPIDYLRDGAPVLVLRTFSKIFGLAGLRVGYGVGPQGLIDLLYRVKEPFNVNRPAQLAALAALDDHEHVARSRAVNAEGKEQLYAGLSALGLSFLPTQTNFILVDLRREAQDVFRGLLRLGVIVRPAGSFGLPERIRVTVGTAEQNARFLAALDVVLGGGAQSKEVAVGQ